MVVVTDSSDDKNESKELEDSGDNAPTESAEAELGKCPILLKKVKLKMSSERLSNDWTSPVYGGLYTAPLILVDSRCDMGQN